MSDFTTNVMCLTKSPGDLGHSGFCNDYVAGENLAFGDVVYMKSDGKMWKADADAAATMPGVAIAVETILADATGKFILLGYLEKTAWDWTIGGIVYVDTTAGVITQTAPLESGDQVQSLGFAITTDVIFINPGYILVEVT